MLIIDVPPIVYAQNKSRKLENFTFMGGDGKNYLVAHGSKQGKLTIDDEQLDLMIAFIDVIICCYPKRVCEVYEPIFPGISKKIAHKWADIPICSAVFNHNGRYSMVVLDYVPSRREWNEMYEDLQQKVQSRS